MFQSAFSKDLLGGTCLKSLDFFCNTKLWNFHFNPWKLYTFLSCHFSTNHLCRKALKKYLVWKSVWGWVEFRQTWAKNTADSSVCNLWKDSLSLLWYEWRMFANNSVWSTLQPTPADTMDLITTLENIYLLKWKHNRHSG